MIRSMTAFGNASCQTDSGTVALEVRSVNSRFLDLHFRLPDEIRHVETALRELISAQLNRGKVEIRASITRRETTDVNQLNLEALRKTAEMLRSVQAIVPGTPAPRLSELLAWPGVQTQADDPAMWDQPALDAARSALAQLQEARQAEGQRLAEMMRDRSAEIRAITTEVETGMPQILADYRERLARKLHDAVSNAFPGGFQHISGTELSERLAHESTLFTLRIDVAEELSRLQSHLVELERILSGKGGDGGGKGKNSGSPGKRLDFLFQEMNREANTLGSKAGSIEMTRAAMDLKLLIEQLREQAQNLE